MSPLYNLLGDNANDTSMGQPNILVPLGVSQETRGTETHAPLLIKLSCSYEPL